MLNLPPLEVADVLAPEGPGSQPQFGSALPHGVAQVDTPTPRLTNRSPVGERGLPWRLAEADRLAAKPLPRVAPGETPSDGITSTDGLILVLPAPSRGAPLAPGRKVLSRKERADWSLFGIDTLAVAEHAGRLFARAERAEPVRPLLMAGVRPQRLAERRQPVSAVTPALSASIAGYLAAAPHGALPAPVKLGEQLDRVAQSDEAAPWAWAVAYRLRALASTPTADRSATKAMLSALSKTAAEASGMADNAVDPAVATELRRARYAIERRVATWWAEGEAAGADRVAKADPLAGARWAMSSVGLGLSPGLTLADTERARADASPRLAQRLEAYERSPNSAAGREIAEWTARLSASDDPAQAGLANAVEQHYRNANLRVAVGVDLLERLLPRPEPVVSPVHDRIAGAPVRGNSTTQTELAVRLVPDPHVWRIGLEANGVVTSQTYSRGGPALLQSNGRTSFYARKLIVVSDQGLLAAPTVAQASGGSRLVGLSTTYDRVPLLGQYIRSTARTEYSRARARAMAEMRVKVERRVGQTLDERATPALAEIERRFEQELISRVDSLGLSVDPIEMRTTDSRLIGRVRVAGPHQLAAHTPRMRAPSDSLLSLQLHESTLNNALEGLGLAGERMTTQELRERLGRQLGIPTDQSAEAGESAVIRFANEEPVRVEFAEGRVHLRLAIDEIVVRGGRHRKFQVHTYYRPVVNGLEARLVQDGTPQIEGRMRATSRIRLHGVLGKVLGEDRQLPLIRLPSGDQQQIARAAEGLVTNQLVIEDGWLGVAIGPARPASVALQVGGYVR